MIFMQFGSVNFIFGQHVFTLPTQ